LILFIVVVTALATGECLDDQEDEVNYTNDNQQGKEDAGGDGVPEVRGVGLFSEQLGFGQLGLKEFMVLLFHVGIHRRILEEAVIHIVEFEPVLVGEFPSTAEVRSDSIDEFSNSSHHFHSLADGDGMSWAQGGDEQDSEYCGQILMNKQGYKYEFWVVLPNFMLE
jgi:hypothetical protein